MLVFKRPRTPEEDTDATMNVTIPIKGGYKEPTSLPPSYRIILEPHDINYMMNCSSVARLVGKRGVQR